MQVNSITTNGNYSRDSNKNRINPARPAQSATQRSNSPHPKALTDKTPKQPGKRLPPSNQEQLPRNAEYILGFEKAAIQAANRINASYEQPDGPEAVLVQAMSPKARRAINAYNNQVSNAQKETVSHLVGIDLYV